MEQEILMALVGRGLLTSGGAALSASAPHATLTWAPALPSISHPAGLSPHLTLPLHILLCQKLVPFLGPWPSPSPLYPSPYPTSPESFAPLRVYMGLRVKRHTPRHGRKEKNSCHSTRQHPGKRLCGIQEGRSVADQRLTYPEFSVSSLKQTNKNQRTILEGV